MLRTVKRVIKPQKVTDGAGVELSRVFGHGETHLTDPFLMLDHFKNDDPDVEMAGFPWHPHRGIETITYMLEGEIQHEDSLENKGILHSGDVQWMTAGSGIIHQEMAVPGGGNIYEGFQLWSNLPATKKMMSPRYQSILSKEIPVVKGTDGSIVKIITGELEGVTGPVKDIITEPVFLDVQLSVGSIKNFYIDSDKNLFLYIFKGDGSVIGNVGIDTISQNTFLVLGEGHNVRIEAGSVGIRFLLIAGKPIHEHIAWAGPIVMNSEEELQEAFDEYQDGTFVKRAH